MHTCHRNSSVEQLGDVEGARHKETSQMEECGIANHSVELATWRGARHKETGQIEQCTWVACGHTRIDATSPTQLLISYHHCTNSYVRLQCLS